MFLVIAFKLPHFEVNHRPKGLHHIINQSHGVVVVAMVQSNTWMKTNCDYSAGGGRAQHGVAVVVQGLESRMGS